VHILEAGACVHEGLCGAVVQHGAVMGVPCWAVLKRCSLPFNLPATGEGGKVSCAVVGGRHSTGPVHSVSTLHL